jgi:regulator of protease activity HflC (stomatin/prohibitin superfamily)
MVETLWALTLAFIVVVILFKVSPIRRVVIYEYQRGLKYRSGRYAGVIGAGAYWILPAFTTITPVDVRPEFITIQGQDVLSADGVTLKVSLASEFQVHDPNVAINQNANFRTSLYLHLQMALREIVGQQKIDAVMDNRAAIGAKLMELASQKAGELGLKLISADVKDIMFPGEMKKAFAQVVKAQKDGQAALERARGETAALRSLANAARAIDDNPNLLQLRALQAVADSAGNTLVLGLHDGVLPVVRKNDQARSRQQPQTENERDTE